MEFHYMDGGPFETIHATVGPCTVVGFQPRAEKFLVLSPTGGTFWGTAARFDPPPPIPAAARKPQVGEVWMHKNGKALFLFSPDANTAGAWYVMRPDATHSWCERYELTRPATPEEAEPFRPIFEGLKRILGEA